MTNNNPLHGMTLQKILEEMVEFFEGWETMGKEIPINCFTKDPSIKSSLTFLRKTPWARQKVEQLYIKIYPHLKKNKLWSGIQNLFNQQIGFIFKSNIHNIIAV